MGVMLLVVVFIYFYLQGDFNEKWFLLFYCFAFAHKNECHVDKNDCC